MKLAQRKSTGSSGVDNMTAKCQHLNRTFHQIEEGDTFGDSYDELETYPEVAISSDSDSTVEDPDEHHMEEASENIHTPTVAVLKTKKLYCAKYYFRKYDIKTFKNYFGRIKGIPSQRTPNRTQQVV